MTTQIGVDFVANTASWDAGVKRAADTLKSQTGQMSASLTKLGGDMAGFGKASVQAAGQTQQINTAMRGLVAAQLQAKASQAELRAAYKQGTIGLEEYKLKQLEVSTAVRLARGEYSRSVSTIQSGTAVVGGSSMVYRQLGFQLSDVAVQFASGTRGAVIFAQQAPQIVQAFTMMGAGASGFSRFMSGPWGAAILTAVSVGGALIAMFQRAGAEAGKSKALMETFADSVDRTKHSFEEVTQAIRDYNAEQRKARETTLDTARAAQEAARRQIEQAIATRQQLRARYEAFDASGPLMSAEAESARQLILGNISNKIADNEAALRRLSAQASESARNVADEVSKLNADPTEQIRAGFARMRDSARASIKDIRELANRLTELRKQEAAALSAVKSTARSSVPQSGSLGDMVALVKTLFPGASITSTTGGKHVKGSDHYKGQAIDFVPSGGMGSISKADARQRLIDAGVDIRRNAQGAEQFFGPGDKGHSDHFHVAFQGSASPERAAQIAQRAAEEAERAREEAIRRQRAFDSDMASVDAELLNAKRSNVSDAETLAQMATDAIRAEQEKAEIAINAKVALGDYTKAQADALKEKLAQITSEKLLTIKVEEAARKYEEQVRDIQAANDNQRDLLTVQESLADTAGERRVLALKLLELDKESERLQLKEIIDRAAIGKATKEEADRARKRLAMLDELYGAKEKATVRATESPMEAYLRDIKKTEAQMNEAFENVAVGGLKSLEDGLVDAMVNFRSLGDVARQVLAQIAADLLRLQIQRMIIAPIAGALGGMFGGGGYATAGMSDVASFVNGLPGRATGGPVSSGSWYVVGENGPELFHAPAAGKIIPNHRIPDMAAQNDNPAGGGSTFHINVTAPSTGDPRRDRQTAMQQAALIRNEVANASRRGF